MACPRQFGTPTKTHGSAVAALLCLSGCTGMHDDVASVDTLTPPAVAFHDASRPAVKLRDAAVGRPPALPTGHRLCVGREGITWTFASPRRCGRYANGDWWVLGPVDIVSITPGCIVEPGRTRNGSMINPSPHDREQGYDSAMFGGNAPDRYDPARNVGLDVSPTHPLRLLPDSSLVTTISDPAPGQLPQLVSGAVLTCVAAVPATDAFRPPYCGADKRTGHRARDLELALLPRLDAVLGTPDTASLVERLDCLWIDHVPGYTTRYLHPPRNTADDDRDLAAAVASASLVLLLDLPDADKRALAIAMTQLGIDVYGIVRAGGTFRADGGHGSGRKFPLLFAGAMLDDDAMLATADGRTASGRFTFAEDAQTFYVREGPPGVFNGGHGGYTAADVGLPEWGNQHAEAPRFDRCGWNADPFRRCCTANVWHGYVLAARLLGLREAWGHPALFDYIDRYMQIETPGHWMRSRDPFCERMWDRYRPQA